MALELPGACDDTPFASDPSIIVFRHGSSGKWFGILLKAPGRAVGLAIDEPVDVLNLKCDPLVAYGMMASHPDIVPAYHRKLQSNGLYTKTEHRTVKYLNNLIEQIGRAHV